MAKSQETFSKKEKEKKRLKKKQDKMQKKAERRAASADGVSQEEMMVYVDENGFLTSTPPDETKKKEIDAESIVIGVPKMEKVEEEPPTGVVDFFNTSKGFGFIRDLDSRERYFFHVNGLLEPIEENDKVTSTLR